MDKLEVSKTKKATKKTFRKWLQKFQEGVLIRKGKIRKNKPTPPWED